MHPRHLNKPHMQVTAGDIKDFAGMTFSKQKTLFDFIFDLINK